MLVWMMYLNECEDGGETSFLYQKYNMKPEKDYYYFGFRFYTYTQRMPSHKTEKETYRLVFILLEGLFTMN